MARKHYSPERIITKLWDIKDGDRISGSKQGVSHRRANVVTATDEDSQV
jgi:hypothetical protein